MPHVFVGSCDGRRCGGRPLAVICPGSAAHDWPAGCKHVIEGTGTPVPHWQRAGSIGPKRTRHVRFTGDRARCCRCGRRRLPLDRVRKGGHRAIRVGTVYQSCRSHMKASAVPQSPGHRRRPLLETTVPKRGARRAGTQGHPRRFHLTVESLQSHAAVAHARAWESGPTPTASRVAGLALVFRAWPVGAADSTHRLRPALFVWSERLAPLSPPAAHRCSRVRQLPTWACRVIVFCVGLWTSRLRVP